MSNLLKWEMKQTLQSKSLWGITAILTIGTQLLGLIAVSEGVESGIELFLTSCTNFNTLLLFFIGIYAGIHITGAFEERKIQAAVMAGNSRFRVIATKLISFTISVAIISIIALSCSAVISFALKGTDNLGGSFGREVIARILVYSLVEVAFSAICFLLSMFMRNLGASIIVNLITLLILNSIGQALISYEWAHKFLKLTPLGQTFIMIGDVSTNNLVLAAAGALLTLGIILSVSFLKFKNEELK